MNAEGLDIEIAVRNFRCFGNRPASLRIRDGFTALIGINNSGKSSLLRIPYEFRNLWQQALSMRHNVLDTADFELPFQPVLLPGERQLRAGCDYFELILKVHNTSDGPLLLNGFPAGVSFVVNPRRASAMAHAVIFDGPKVMRPAYRTGETTALEPLVAALSALSDSMYVGPFRNALSVADSQSYFDLLIGTGFVKRFAEFKSGDDSAHNEAVVALTDDVRRIFGYRRFEINPSPDQRTLQVTVDGRSFRLSELGSGIAHFVIVLVNVLVRRPSVLLIDEPELNLHAALQLDFLSVLAQASEYGVVFATHSMGLARSSAEHISVVSPAEDGSRTSDYEGHHDLASLAAQLGFDGRPEIGFRKVLLVEGKTEVRALLQMLRLYGKEHEIALIPLGGGELIHRNSEVELREIQRLGPVTYLIDSERSKAGGEPSARHADFAALCTELGIQGHMLDRRALENYFPQRAIDAVFGGVTHTALRPFEAPTRGNGWSKKHNWRIASEMAISELAETDLGAFLHQL